MQRVPFTYTHSTNALHSYVLCKAPVHGLTFTMQENPTLVQKTCFREISSPMQEISIFPRKESPSLMQNMAFSLDDMPFAYARYLFHPCKYFPPTMQVLLFTNVRNTIHQCKKYPLPRKGISFANVRNTLYPEKESPSPM